MVGFCSYGADEWVIIYCWHTAIAKYCRGMHFKYAFGEAWHLSSMPYLEWYKVDRLLLAHSFCINEKDLETSLGLSDKRSSLQSICYTLASFENRNRSHDARCTRHFNAHVNSLFSIKPELNKPSWIFSSIAWLIRMYFLERVGLQVIHRLTPYQETKRMWLHKSQKNQLHNFKMSPNISLLLLIFVCSNGFSFEWDVVGPKQTIQQIIPVATAFLPAVFKSIPSRLAILSFCVAVLNSHRQRNQHGQSSWFPAARNWTCT